MQVKYGHCKVYNDIAKVIHFGISSCNVFISHVYFLEEYDYFFLFK